MSDPIGAIGRAGIGAALEVGGGDAVKKYTVDIGKGDGNGVSFGDTLSKAINQVSDAQDHSADMVGKFLRGEPVELHQVMAAGEEAGIALEMMIELRNKFTDAYRTLISMQS
jgi:flagellar hook-basal body complex protein FliE